MGESSSQAFRVKAAAVLAEHRDAAASTRVALGVPDGVRNAVQKAFSELPAQVSSDLAFHLSDWRADAAFLIALQLAPERFTVAEVREGVTQFLVHAPNHVAAAG